MICDSHGKTGSQKKKKRKGRERKRSFPHTADINTHVFIHTQDIYYILPGRILHEFFVYISECLFLLFFIFFVFFVLIICKVRQKASDKVLASLETNVSHHILSIFILSNCPCFSMYTT